MRGVARAIVEQMAGMIMALKEKGVSILLSRQNPRFAGLVGDRAYLLGLFAGEEADPVRGQHEGAGGE